MARAGCPAPNELLSARFLFSLATAAPSLGRRLGRQKGRPTVYVARVAGWLPLAPSPAVFGADPQKGSPALAKRKRQSRPNRDASVLAAAAPAKVRLGAEKRRHHEGGGPRPGHRLRKTLQANRLFLLLALLLARPRRPFAESSASPHGLGVRAGRPVLARPLRCPGLRWGNLYCKRSSGGSGVPRRQRDRGRGAETFDGWQLRQWKQLSAFGQGGRVLGRPREQAAAFRHFARHRRRGRAGRGSPGRNCCAQASRGTADFLALRGNFIMVDFFLKCWSVLLYNQVLRIYLRF